MKEVTMPSLKGIWNTTIDPSILFLIYMVGFCFDFGRMERSTELILAMVSFFGLMYPLARKSYLYWLSFVIILVVNIEGQYFAVANHYFVTIYAALALAVESYLDEHKIKRSINQARIVLLIVFAFATFHKLVSSNFMSGRLLATYILRGHSLEAPAEILFPGFENSAASSYQAAYQSVKSDSLLGTMSAGIDIPYEHFQTFCILLALVISVLEFAFMAIFAIKRIYYTQLPAIFVLAFVWGTALFRNEHTFFSLVCTLGLMALPHTKPLWRNLLVLSMFAFWGMIISGLDVSI